MLQLPAELVDARHSHEGVDRHQVVVDLRAKSATALKMTGKLMLPVGMSDAQPTVPQACAQACTAFPEAGAFTCSSH